MNSSREVYALVLAYLSKADTSIAKHYQQKTKAEPLDEGAPSLEEVVQYFLRACKTNRRAAPQNEGNGKTLPSIEQNASKNDTAPSSYTSLDDAFSTKRKLNETFHQLVNKAFQIQHVKRKHLQADGDKAGETNTSRVAGRQRYVDGKWHHQKVDKAEPIPPDEFSASSETEPTRSPKKRCSPSPGTCAGHSTEFGKETKRRKTGEKRDYRFDETWSHEEATDTKSVKKTKAVMSHKKSQRSTLVKRDPTRTPKQRHPAFRNVAETPTDNDSDSGVDDQCSVYSSVSRLAAVTEDDLPSADGDEWVRCDLCDRLWEDGDCLLHGPPIPVPDSPVPVDIPPAERASRSVPAVLRVAPSGVHRGGLGVWARRPLPAGLRFGPYRGRRESNRARASAGACSWEVHRNARLWFCVDGADPAHSNWMRYVNCARSAAHENVTAYQHRWKIWYRTCRPIPQNTELLVYYGDEYHRELARDAAGKRRR